ncbi:MAG: glycosyltransferase [Myxococcota bacterium]
MGPMTRTLVIGQKADAVTEWAISPFRYFKPLLRLRLGMRVQIERSEGLHDLRGLIEKNPSDLVFITTNWKDSAEDTLALFKELDAMPRRPRLVYLDTFDQVSSPLFGLMPHVDLYMKKQIYRQLAEYSRDYGGGLVTSDYVSRQFGHDLGDWYFGSPIPSGCEEKLWLSWNLGTATELLSYFARSWGGRLVPWAKREVAVHYRVSLSKVEDWYSVHRVRLGEALRAASPHIPGKTVIGVGPEDRVPMEQFVREMKHTKIAVSPFGWGEVTDRDFRVVSEGALLMKPDVSHITTEPNIYEPFRTYVPFQWDGSDLLERCRYYLEHPVAAQRITKAARKAYFDWFKELRFIGRIQDVLEHLHLN